MYRNSLMRKQAFLVSKMLYKLTKLPGEPLVVGRLHIIPDKMRRTRPCIVRTPRVSVERERVTLLYNWNNCMSAKNLGLFTSISVVMFNIF